MRSGRLGGVAATFLLAASLIAPAVTGAAPVYKTPPPPLDPDFYPCMANCHKDIKPNPTRRKLTEEHGSIQLKHAQDLRWCLDCHDATDRDKLHMQNGDRLDFSESHRLCGQCHGDKYRDWKTGVHGKRTGHWNGDKEYLLCAHCHNPHEPAYKALTPEPAPKVPGNKAQAAGH